MKSRSRLKPKGSAAHGSAASNELPKADHELTGDDLIRDLIADLNADEKLELACELERRANLIRAILGKKPTAARPPGEETAGNWVNRNVWIKLGLSPNQARQLKALGRKILTTDSRTCAEVARWIITQGLANIELLEAATGGFKVQSKLGLAGKERDMDARARARIERLN